MFVVLLSIGTGMVDNELTILSRVKYLAKNINETRSVTFYLLLAALLFQGLSGLAGGTGLISDPSGDSLGIPAIWLKGSPFSNYLVPGIILFSVLGVFPTIAAYALWKRYKHSLSISMIIGLLLIGWIFVEIIIIGYQSDPPLQLIYGILGLIILLFSSVLLNSNALKKDQNLL